MQEAHRRFGVPIITYDQKLARPRWAENEIAMWLHGAGTAHAAAGMSILPREVPRGANGVDEGALSEAARGSGARSNEEARSNAAGRDEATKRARRSGKPPEEEDGRELAQGGAVARWADGDWSLSEADFREVYYSHAGGYDQSWLAEGAPNWLGRFTLDRLGGQSVGASALRGRNTFVHVKEAELASFEEGAQQVNRSG